MAYDQGFSRRTSSERDIQPVAIMSVNPTDRTAIGITRVRHSVQINCAYATGDTITVPAVGEQWYVERIDNEWRLYGRIPFNDATLNIAPEEGQVSVGSASGPLELNGPEVRFNSKVFRLNGVYYRDSGTGLERSADMSTWTEVGVAGASDFLQQVAKALTGYTGTSSTDALTSLGNWSTLLQVVIDNFGAFWTALCDNTFVTGLKKMGLGDTDVAKIVDGLQNFLNYLFSVVFCDFNGDLTPQTILARLRDLLGPLTTNPFALGLQSLANILGVGVGNLLNDVVAGLSEFVKLVFDIMSCNFTDLAALLLPGSNGESSKIQQIIDSVGATFGPANIVKFLFETFSFLADPTNPVGAFVLGLQSFFTLLFESTGSLLRDAVSGAVQFVKLLFDVLFCQADPTQLAAVLGGIADVFGPTAIIQSIDTFFQFFRDNPFITGIRDFLTAFFPDLLDAGGSLIKDVVTGLVKFVQVIYDALTCQLAPEELASLVSGFTAGGDSLGGILAKLSELTTSLLDNPLITALQALATQIGSTATGLLEQLITVTGDLMNWLLKVAKTVVPLDLLWETLLPFVDWAKVDAVVLPDLADILGGVISNPLLKAVFSSIEAFLNLATDGVANFFQNIVTLFGNVSSFFTTLFNTPQDAINYFLTDVIKIAEMGVDGVVTFISDFIGNAGSAITTLVENLLALFGINFTPTDANGDPVAFNAVTAFTSFVNKLLTTGLGGVFGNTVAEVTRFFTRIRNLFGLNLSAFTDITNFDFASAASGFINAVLVNAPTLAIQTLSGVMNIAGTLLYDLAKGIIEAIRKIPLVGAPTANVLQTLLDGFVTFTRGNVNSGTNLLADAGAEKSAFWNQTGVTYSTSPKRSGGGSLMVSGGNVVWMNVNDLGEVSPLRTQPNEYLHMEAYVYSYYSTTVYLYAKTDNSLDGTTATYYLTSFSVGTSWTKVQADVQVPSPWDRISFGVYAAGYPVYVDDMLAREITASQLVNSTVSNLNYALYRSYAAPSTSTQINVNAVPAGIPASSVNSPSGSGTIATDIGVAAYGTGLAGAVNGPGGLVGTVGSAAAGTGLAGTVSGSGGLVTQVGNTAAGTGLNGTVYGKGGAGGLVGTGGTSTTATNAYNGVYGTGGLIPKLYGAGQTTPQTRVSISTIPPEVGAMGTGVHIVKKSGAYSTQSSPTGTKLLDSFYTNNVQTTTDLVVESNSGNVQVRATVAAWYLVEMAFGITKSLKMYQFYFNPVLYRNGSVYKFGNGIGNSAYYSYNTAAGLVLSVNNYSVVPEMVQSSFIVYLGVGDTVQPGYVWHPDPTDARGNTLTSDTIIVTDTYGYWNYFSMGLLNRNLN